MNHKMNQEKMKQYLLFMIFFFLLLMQFRLIGVQYDDYGYYSLNYGAITPHMGSHFTFMELFRFLGEHYIGANGRLLSFGIWLTIYKIGGLIAVQISAAMIVTCIWILLCKIAFEHLEHKNSFLVIGTLILCFCYGSISIDTHQHGTYWFAAFYIYYMPIIATELFIILYDKYATTMKWKHLIFLLPLVLVSAWSGETWSVGTVALIGVLNILAFSKNKKVDSKHILLFFTAILGLCILLNSPGIQLRAGDSKWGFQSIFLFMERMKDVISVFFSGANLFYLLFILTACFLLGFANYLKSKKLYDLIFAFLILVLEVITFIQCVIIHRFYYLSIVIILIPVCRYYYRKKDRKRNMLLFTAFISMASLVAVPTVTYRIFLPFEVCSFLIVFDACYELYQYTLKSKYKNCFGFLLVLYVLAMVLICGKNYIKIYHGYKENAIIYEYNHKTYLEAKDKVANGESVTEIHLKKYRDDMYATTMLYQDPWFKEYIEYYYELPSGINILFDDEDPIASPKQILRVENIDFHRLNNKTIEIVWPDLYDDCVSSYIIQKRTLPITSDEWHSIYELQSDGQVNDYYHSYIDENMDENPTQYEYRIEIVPYDYDNDNIQVEHGKELIASNIKVCIDPGHFDVKREVADVDEYEYVEGIAMLEVGLKLKELLKTEYGIDASLTRETGTILIDGIMDDELDSSHISLRGEYAKKEECDLYLSLHSNSNEENANDYPTYFQPIELNKTIIILNTTALDKERYISMAIEIGKQLSKTNFELGLSTTEAFREAHGHEIKEWTKEYNDSLNELGTILYRAGKKGDYYGVLRGASNVSIPGMIIEHGFHSIQNTRKAAKNNELYQEWAKADATGIAIGFGFEKFE